MDRLINKPIKIPLTKEEEKNFKYSKKILYQKEPKDKEILIGTILGYEVPSEKTGVLVRLFREDDKQKLKELEQRAKKMFVEFKREFKQEFPEAVPINARMGRNGKIIYFYFFAETRFNFSDFVKAYRKKIGMNFFLYQVGARERIRLFPSSQYRECPTSGKRQLCCVMYKHPLPSVESETIITQGLESRGIENLKGMCGKLKCCLNFEQDVYEQIMKNYPAKGSEFEYEGKKYICLSNNIFSGETLAKNIENGEIIKILLNKPLAPCSTCKA